MTPLKLRPSRKVQLVLAKTLGPLFGETPNLAAALDKLDDDDLELVTQTFSAACTFDENGQNYRLDKQLDAHFSGRPLAYWNWLAGCLQAEYEDFFAAGRKLLEKFSALSSAKTPTGLKFQSASTGTSGE